MRIVVTGGMGALGSRVMARLVDTGHEAVSASRRSGVDLSNGTGVDEVLAGADAVVHTADTTRQWRFQSVTVGGTRHLVEAVARHPHPPHLVYISIVGCDRSPNPYYRAKTEAEHAIEKRGVPATIQRSTQFHSLAAAMARMSTIGPICLSLKGMRVQPVDIDTVAERLAELATTPGPGSGTTRALDLGGPQVFSMPEVGRLVAEHQGHRPPRVLNIPAIGGVMRAFADGSNLAGADAITGGRTFAEWLAAQPQRLRGR